MSLPRLLPVAALALALPGALAAEPSSCVRTLGAAAARVAATQAAAQLACLRDAARGAIADAAGCLVADPAGRVAAAVADTATAAIGACEEQPLSGVAPRLAGTANAAATVHVRGLVRDLLGDDLAAAVARTRSDRRTARCQQAALRAAWRVAAARLDDALACQADALAAAPASDDLAACVGRSSKRVARALERLAAALRRRCAGIDVAAALPGRCAGATDLVACAGGRVACRTCRLLDGVGALGAPCEELDDGASNGSCRMLVSVSGDAIPFHDPPLGRIEGAEISILEHPEMRVVTGADGHFAFDGLEEGSEVTLVLAHPGYHAMQTGTIRLGSEGATRVTFQAVIHTIYDALAIFIGVVPDPAACQLVTTVTRVGKSMYDFGAHGEAGATVRLDPDLPAVHGPIYFNASVLPDRSLDRTSDDGGVLFVNVPVGEYTWRAHEPGKAFSRLRMKCRPGVLVNASPPWGLQAQ